jgi:hypothetical protein
MQNNSLAIGTLGGTFLSMVPNIPSEHIANTVFLAALGAVVSFMVSFCLKCILKKHFKRKKPL